MAPEAAEAAARRDQAAGRYSRKSSKQRTLELIKSLEPTDDERTGISKKISWILRHGASRVNVKMDPDGWVKVSDLLATEILDDVTEDTLMAVIVDSNAQKLRYKLKESSEGQYIKAYSKTERKATTGSVPPPATEPERKGQTLRQEAQPFVPSSFSPVAGLPQLGYPWPLAGGFGFGPMMPQWPSAYPMAPFPGMEGPLGLAQGRYRGRIKSFNVEKGFGFIECAETHAQFDRDVFLHKAQYGDMTVGTEVTFKVETNKQGMPQAKDLAPFGVSGTLLAGSGGGKAGRGKGKGGRAKGGGREKGKGGGGKGERSGKGASKEQSQAGEAAVAGAGDAAAAPSAGPSEAEAAAPPAEAAAAPESEAAAPEAAASPPAEAAATAVDEAAAGAGAAASTAPAAAAAQEAPATEPTAAAAAG